MKSADVRRSIGRVRIARVLLLAGFAVLAVRAAHLAVFEERASDLGEDQTLRTLTLPPARGNIIDRSGAALALSIDAPSVYVISRDLEDPSDAARKLAKIFRRDARKLEARLRDREGFQFLERWVDTDRAERTQALALRGVGIVHEPRRVYPHRELASRILGFANIDAKGVRGIEQQEDSWLRGTVQRLPVERDGSGQLMLVSGGETWGTAGGDVALTIDAAMQADAERSLAAAIQRTGARGGVVISMDARTGEIYGLAEAPTFDPNQFRTLDYDATGSGAFLDAAEPGSAFKPFGMAAALETGAIRADQWFDLGDGSLHVPGKTIRDDHPHPVLDPAGILGFSSNVGAVVVAQAMGPSAHHEMLRRFGFGHSTRSGFPGESAGMLRPWRDWQPLDHATIAFGQGVSVTPIQLAAATAAIANGGEWVRPRLVAARRVADAPWQPTAREPVRRVLRRETAASVLSMMEAVVGPEGTGRRAALSGVRVAGKTGTAQKWDAANDRYSNQRFRAWFVGIVPADAPRLVIVAGLDEPRRPHHTGGGATAPLFAEVATAHLARFGVFTDVPAPAPPVTRTAQQQPPPATKPAPPPAPKQYAAAPPPAPKPTRVDPPKTAPVAASAPTPAPAPAPAAPAPGLYHALGDRVLLPDFTGLSANDVTRITAGGALRVRFEGKGRAIRQDPPPGTVMPASGIVVIELGETASGDRAARIAGATAGGRS